MRSFSFLEMDSCLCSPPVCRCTGLAGHTAMQDPGKGTRQKVQAEDKQTVPTPAARPVFLFSLGSSREPPAQPLALPAPGQAGASSDASALEPADDLAEEQGPQAQEEPPHTFELGFAWDSMPLDVFVKVGKFQAPQVQAYNCRSCAFISAWASLSGKLASMWFCQSVLWAGLSWLVWVQVCA